MAEPIHTATTAREKPHSGKLFLRWYFRDRPRELVHAYRAYAAAFAEVFAFVFLFKTLLSPWKNITDRYPSKGFNLGAILETLTLNITTRAIGSVVRILSMIAGLIVQVLLFAGFVCYGLIWLLFPLLILAGIPALLVLAL